LYGWVQVRESTLRRVGRSLVRLFVDTCRLADVSPPSVTEALLPFGREFHSHARRPFSAARRSPPAIVHGLSFAQLRTAPSIGLRASLRCVQCWSQARLPGPCARTYKKTAPAQTSLLGTVFRSSTVACGRLYATLTAACQHPQPAASSRLSDSNQRPSVAADHLHVCLVEYDHFALKSHLGIDREDGPGLGDGNELARPIHDHG
jgi:hypothetical protein